MTVLVTGASGYIGTQLLKKLVADKEIKKIVAVDLKPPALKSPKLFFVLRDIRQGLAPILAEHRPKTVFHLAFALNPLHNVGDMYAINVKGTIQALKDCEQAGVERFIYPSSATAYGASPHNPIPIPESYPVNPKIRFSYARHKAKIEIFLQGFRKKSKMSYCIFRPVVVFGPHVNNFISQGIESPILVVFKGEVPPLQLVHEEDVAAAFYFGFKKKLEGFYNVAGDGTISLEEGETLFGRKPRELPFPLVYAVNYLLWNLRVFKAPPEYLEFLRYPWIVDSTKLKEAGFQYQYTAKESLLQYLEARKKAG